MSKKKKLIDIKPMFSLPCAPAWFRIRGKDAIFYDFGTYKYENSDTPNNPNILQWGCYGKYFDTIPFEENQKVAKMYNLTKEEYESICSELRSTFYIGTCDWCV